MEKDQKSTGRRNLLSMVGISACALAGAILAPFVIAPYHEAKLEARLQAHRNLVLSNYTPIREMHYDPMHSDSLESWIIEARRTEL